MARPKSFEPPQALEIAMKTFWRRGFHAVSIDDLISAMSLSRQSLYDTFGDKETLFAKALSQYENAYLTKEVDHVSSRQPGDRLFGTFAGWIRADDQAAAAGCLLTNSLAEFTDDRPRLRMIVGEINGNYESKLALCCRAAQEEGAIPNHKDCALLAETLLYIRHGIMISKRAGGGANVRAAQAAFAKLLQ
ncbi:MAG TPA: TetR/AcrR family transcriptional regulator [Phycisphaerae bacterium]|nr:TetR/AcrR family transcriptional regulator [Phycisphaerae bacterium]